MHLRTLILILTALLLPLLTASVPISGSTPAASEVDLFSTANYECQSWTSAPTVTDVRWTIDYLRRLGTRVCGQHNWLGSKCSKVAWHGSAKISLCGKIGSYVRCWQAAEIIETMIAQCERGGLVGGNAHLGGGFRIAVHG